MTTDPPRLRNVTLAMFEAPLWKSITHCSLPELLRTVSIPARFSHTVNHHDLHGTLGGVELQPELFLQSGQDRGRAFRVVRRCRCRHRPSVTSHRSKWGTSCQRALPHFPHVVDFPFGVKFVFSLHASLG